MRNKKQSRSGGFTMVEVLAAAAALIILLGLSTVAVVTYIHKLQITKLDNAAREIYMAAQNNAVLLSNEGRLEKLVVKKGVDGKPTNEISILSPVSNPGSGESGDGYTSAYYVSSGDAVIKSLITDGSIEPSLWNGCFYVVYESKSGSVTDVFYSDKKLNITNNFQDFYNKWSAVSKEERMKNSPMIGHYDGGLANGERIAALLTPIVRINNGEKLTVEVSYRVPREFDKKVELEVNVKYKDKTSKLDTEFQGVHEQDSTGNYVYSYEWVLDSLDKENDKQFKDRFKDMELGGDFTVSAEVTYNDSSTSTFSREATNNSLFAYFDEKTDKGKRSSDGDTAYISCLRHLQNLSEKFSNVGGKKDAVQVANIDCNNDTYPNYNFKPIKNEKNNVLESYTGGEKGSEFVIRNLKIEGRETAYNTGLFEDADGTKFTNIRLVNASVKGGEKRQESENPGRVGALVGEAKNCTFNNCWVYWERDPAAQSSLNDLLVKDGEYQYQIQGQIAGGLVGILEDKNTIENCLAATLVKGTVSAGGLAGNVSGSSQFYSSISGSYADCYLASAENGKAAGIIGNSSCNIELTDCYAAGFIDMDGKGTKTAAGLFLGSGKVTDESKNVYSVMRFTDYNEKDTEKTVHYLYENAPEGLDAKKFYYLGNTDKDGNKIPCARSYADMTADDFIATMGSTFGKKSAVESHPYNLQKDLDLKAYSFPGLVALPHYGDWGAQFGKSSLVYYERYADGTFGFSGGNENHLSNSKTIVVDGYAIAILAEDLKDKTVSKDSFFTVNYPSGGTGAHEYKVNLPENAETIDGEKYYLAVLPKEISNSDTADKYFYQPITYSFSIDGAPTKGEYYFCPHFAKTAIEKDDMPVKAGGDEVDLEAAAKELEGRRGIAVRTPRHLYSLSKYGEYYHKLSYPGYNYEQELDLDYSTYTEYNAKSWSQYPIGDISIPFNGVYNGMCHVIKNVPFKTDNGKSDIGLFGYSNGTLQNIVLKMNAEKPITMAMHSGDMYVGALAGGNGGTVNNCAVYDTNISFTASVAGRAVYFGGLVGRNRGVIRNCAADTARFDSDGSTFAKTYAGGLVGENELSGTVSGSYAVGRLSATVDQTSSASICGFVGHNRGSIERSYAAVNLKSSGAGVSVSGFCGETHGTQGSTYYLNQGNFTYRGESYNASYVQKTANPMTYAQLAKLTDTAVPAVEGMLYCANAASGGFPYPTAVKDAGGRPVHYGQWPEQMELGVMGVYYWEKLTIGTEPSNSETSYNLSLLAVDPDANTITKQTTLSNAHSDGGVVTEFGYGYYNDVSNETVELTTQDINYMGVYNNTFNSGVATVEDVDKAFKELMPGFDFHSYQSFSEGKKAGLYPTALNGTFTLYETYNNQSIDVSFTVNPHFADALAVATAPNGWSVDSSIKVTPGTENNPYEVRAVQQLQNINWNSVSKDTKTVINGNENSNRFPYLSYQETIWNGWTFIDRINEGNHHWHQTHDLNGSGATMTPIAEYYDSTSDSLGNLYGWFGGIYDGDGYVIENLNIQGQKSSCAGLFGVVYNGTLKNIILYSSNGESTVNAYRTTIENQKTQSAWYAMGALAGLAASRGDGNSIQNCAVAGYKINGDIQINKGGWGGGEVGGLVGISNMNLSGCSAVTNIKIPNTIENNDNLRVGGIVGSCQKSIENCYAGGTIEVEEKTGVVDNTNIYVGGIVGGSYFKPLAVAGNNNELIGTTGTSPYGTKELNQQENDTDNALKNCYSYVSLPKKELKVIIKDKNGNITGEKLLGAIYALGGTGEIVPAKSRWKNDAANHGICSIENCYYLNSVSPGISGKNVYTDSSRPWTDINEYDNELTALTYDQLSGKADLPDGVRIYAKLTAFDPVTTEVDGVSVKGKYSFPPSNQEMLAGMDYPFPTILTRKDSQDSNIVYHVHYGQWPLNGIQRKNGAAPIELDIFTAEKSEEELTLTAGAADNGWNVVSADGNIATATIDASGNLTVTAVGEGTTTVTVNNGAYTLPITVNVTAVLELRTAENPVTLYTNDSTELVLRPYGKDGNELNLADKGITLTLKGAVVNSNYITYSQITRGTGDKINSAILSLETGVGQGSTTVNISYDYTYNGADYKDKVSTVSLQISEPPVKFEPETVSVEVGETADVALSLVDESDASMVIKSVKSGNSNVAAVVQSAESGKYTVTGVAAGETELVFEVDITQKERVHHVQLALKVTVTAPEADPVLPDQSGESTENA